MKKILQLYDFQEKAVENTICLLKTKKNRSLIVIPTGGGKTVIFCEIVKRLNFKTLFLAHTKELVQQALNTSRIMGLTENLITFDTIQRISHRANKIDDSTHFDLIIIDECHRAPSTSYMKILERFKSSKIIGLTATPYRADGKIITNIFGFPEEPLTMIDLIKRGFLCDLVGHRIKTGVTLENVKRTNSTKDFSSGCLAAVINVKERNEIILNTWIKLANNEKTLGFAATVGHCESLCKTFNNHGIKSAVIKGSLNPSQRELIINNFRLGHIRVLWNCEVLTEGFDDPEIKNILMARPTLSKRLYVQMVGRGARICQGKEFCRVIEFTDNNYDVCNLKDLLKIPATKLQLIEGEKISNFHERSQKELLEGSGEIIEENFNIIEEQFDPKASPSLLLILDKYGIKYSKNISEFQANLYLNQYLMENINGIDNSKKK